MSERVCPNCGSTRFSKARGRGNKLGHNVVKFESLGNWVTTTVFMAAVITFIMFQSGDILRPTTWVPFLLIFGLIGTAMVITVIRTVPAIQYKCRMCGAFWTLRSDDPWPPSLDTTESRN